MEKVQLISRFVTNVFVTALCITATTSTAYSWIDTKEFYIELTSDQPAVVGAPVGFSARLHGIKDNSSSFTYEWYSHIGGGETFHMTLHNQSTECNITTTVETVGNREMKVSVERDGFKLDKASISYTITSSINGLITVEQSGNRAKRPGVISTNTTTNVSFAIHDPHKYFENSTVFYTWAIGSAALTYTYSNFSYNFTTASSYTIMVMVTALTKMDTHPFYIGSAITQLITKDSIKMSNVTGQTAIQHGDLLDIEISCKGSMPVSYCWYFTQGYVNASAEYCEEPTETTSCDFVIVRYFKKSGNYKLVLIVDNDVDHKVNIYNINVFQRGAEPQLSPIIVPLACCSLALVIIVVGIMYYIHTRRNYTVEVADFDFQQSDNYEFQSFFERMVEVFTVWCGFGQFKKKTLSYRRIPAQIT